MLLLLKLHPYFPLYCVPERQRFIQILLPTHLILDTLECFVPVCFLGIWVDVHQRNLLAPNSFLILCKIYTLVYSSHFLLLVYHPSSESFKGNFILADDVDLPHYIIRFRQLSTKHHF